MPHADRPYLTRPLAGVDQALGEGRARPPAELLDQLRERLDRLDDNHPSAGARSTDREQVHDIRPAADQDRYSPQRKGGAGQPCDDKPSDHGASDHGASDRRSGDPSAIRPVGPPALAAADGAAGGLAADGQLRVAEIGRAADDAGFRPWFADDPGAPWFVESWFTE